MARSRIRLILWGAGLIALVVAVLIFFAGLNNVLRWVPLTTQWNLRVAEGKLARKEQEARVLGAINEGQGEIAASVERHTIIIREADRIAADAEIEARTAPDAETPLDPDRADRLRRSDERLCELVPGSCAAPAADHP